MLKLRTMAAGSDPVGVGTAVLRDDPRVTRSGRFLRRTSLDELPNLVNVLRGEMAIVGPRPTLAAHVEHFSIAGHPRFDVLPGITGWAQVQGRAGHPLGGAGRARRLVRRAPQPLARPPHPRQDHRPGPQRPRPRPRVMLTGRKPALIVRFSAHQHRG